MEREVQFPLIRCSELGKINTRGKKKDEPLGQTAKTLLIEKWIQKKYGREKPEINSKYLEKGTENEEVAISMLATVKKYPLFNNKERHENDWITGEFDCMSSDTVFDTKCPYDIWTFANARLDKDYEWQLRGYMWLTGLKKAELVYCLTDLPTPLQFDECRKLSYQRGYMGEITDDIEEEVRNRYTYQDIPLKDKVKIFKIEHDEHKIEELKEQINRARDFFNSIEKL